MMRKVLKIAVLTIGAWFFTAGNSWASMVVYEEVELFDTLSVLNDTFTVTDAGTHMATLTDFDFPELMAQSGMAVSTATELLGSLNAPGSFTFEATPGEYFVAFFGEAGASTSYGMYGIDISRVPVPAAVWLFGSGLLGLGAIKRKKA